MIFGRFVSVFMYSHVRLSNSVCRNRFSIAKVAPIPQDELTTKCFPTYWFGIDSESCIMNVNIFERKKSIWTIIIFVFILNQWRKNKTKTREQDASRWAFRNYFSKRHGSNWIEYWINIRKFFLLNTIKEYNFMQNKNWKVTKMVHYIRRAGRTVCQKRTERIVKRRAHPIWTLRRKRRRRERERHWERKNASFDARSRTSEATVCRHCETAVCCSDCVRARSVIITAKWCSHRVAPLARHM